MHRRILSFLKLISISRWSILGAALTTASILADVVLVLGELFVFESNPYMGIFAYLVFPSLAVLGLVLIPVGVVLRARATHRRIAIADIVEMIETQRLNHTYVLQIVFGLTMLNMVIFGILGYRGFHYTESKEFCGELCHEVMHPELSTYSRSPHSEISCVECHIGSGAQWFVKSKLSGARQVLAVMLDTYSRPIETPIHNLRPARDVCEVCHRPEIFYGDLIKTIQHFSSDEANTRTYTVLNMRVGSGGDAAHRAHGIHWHVSRNHELRYYATDPKRETIIWVEVTNPDGTRDVWRRAGDETDEENLPADEIRLMDCVDCHNRPTHIYLGIDDALDEWMSSGRIDPSVPWIRKECEELLERPYETKALALAELGRLPEVYQERYPAAWAERREAIEASTKQLQEIYRLFVYPEMNIGWNTYNSLIGHPTPHTAACFRCHNGVLRNSRNEPITLECDACHFVLATKEEDPAVLKWLKQSRSASRADSPPLTPPD